MQRLKILVYPSGKAEPETIVTIPLTTLRVGLKLLPKKIRTSLTKEGIDLSDLGQTTGESGPKGTLIEIETAVEKIVVSAE